MFRSLVFGTPIAKLKEQALAYGWYEKDVDYCVKELELLEKMKNAFK